MRSIRAWTVIVAVLFVSALGAAAQAGIRLNDTSGATWQVSVTNGGSITTTQVSHRAAPTGIMLNADDGTASHSFLIGVGTDGALKVTQTKYHRSQPLGRKMNDEWQIGVTRSGELVASRQNPEDQPVR
jgi:hypothetical protein